MSGNPLVASATASESGPGAWSGVWIAEDIISIKQGVQNGDWIDCTLGAVGLGLDGFAAASDPLGSALQYGAAWLMEHLEPLREGLDKLAGDQTEISAHAQTWRNVSTSLSGTADRHSSAVMSDVGTWGGSAGPAYRTWANEQNGALRGLVLVSETVSVITEMAGAVVSVVRELVRDFIATAVSRCISYAAELGVTLGLATPLVVEQVVSTVASTAAKITRKLKALISSLRKLLHQVDELKVAAGALRKSLKPRQESAIPAKGSPDAVGSAGAPVEVTVPFGQPVQAGGEKE